MKRSTYWKGRLERWQQWYYSSGGGGGSSCLYRERVDCETFGVTTPDVNEEALVTDQLVAALPEELNRTVREVYLDNLGRGPEEIAARLNCGVRTLHNRLCHADIRLDALLAARRASKEAAAERGVLLVRR